MLPLRSLLVIDASEDAALASARSTVADVVVIDLAAPHTHSVRTGARAVAPEAIDAIGGTGRPVLARVSSASTGELAADLEAVVRPTLAAVVLAGTEVPQDARDADVLLRKFEFHHEIEPGAIRLIPELDSAAGVEALPGIIAAVDRHDAVALNPARLHRDLGLGRGAHEPLDSVMARVALAARAAELPWLVTDFETERGTLEASRAHALGAAGVAIQTEGAARGTNSLFALDATEVAAARAVLREWDRLRADDEIVGVALVGDEAHPRAELVDRRAMRAARLLVARADAIAERERLRS
jgi:citrate lyase beta subunit